jgi:hypothetical protein
MVLKIVMFFGYADGGSKFQLNVGLYLQVQMTSLPRTPKYQPLGEVPLHNFQNVTGTTQTLHMLLTVTINGAPYAILTATQTANYI